jgi:two-component system chemotaxis response regulator CheY
MRSQSEFSGLPVLMVTSEGDADKVAEALEAGANEYIIKPFTKDAIAQKLNMIGVQITA